MEDRGGIGNGSAKTIFVDARVSSAKFRWLARNQEFRRSYAIARDCLAVDLMDEILEIVDDSRVHIDHRRRRIKARKWMLTHLAPKKYYHR